MSDIPEPSVDRLDAAAGDLGRGDWRAAMLRLFTGGDAGPDRQVVDVVFCLRCVARGMRIQGTTGDVAAASLQYAAASRKLAEGAPVQLDVEPPRHLPITVLRWETALLVRREHDDLTALRLIFGELPRGSREMIYATVEYLTWVEFDPFTVRIHRHDRELTDLDDDAYARLRVGNRRDICARATHLRHFAAVRSGSVNERTWHRMGGYPALREKALRVLAAEPITRRRPGIPVRLGRERAWQYALGWAADTPA